MSTVKKWDAELSRVGSCGVLWAGGGGDYERSGHPKEATLAENDELVHTSSLIMYEETCVISLDN